MLLAEDFRAMARDALRGRWPGAAGVALLAAFLGATMVDGASFNFNVGQKDVELFRRIYEGSAWHAYMGFIIGAAIILIVYWLVRLVIGGAVTLGYAQYNLNLMDRKEAQVTDLFCHFNRLGTAFCMQFLRGLYIFLWSLLFVIPGIIASYRYRFAELNLYENPELGVFEAINLSKRQTMGYKSQLLFLDLSFFGWSLLATAPLLLENTIYYMEISTAQLGMSLQLFDFSAFPGGYAVWVLLSSLWQLAVSVFYLAHYHACCIGYYETAKATSRLDPCHLQRPQTPDGL